MAICDILDSIAYDEPGLLTTASFGGVEDVARNEMDPREDDADEDEIFWHDCQRVREQMNKRRTK